MRFATCLAGVCFAAMLITSVVTADEKSLKPVTEEKALACTACNAGCADEGFEAMKKLAGTWVSEKPGEDGKPMVMEFKVIAGGTTVQETMFPGSAHEMVNLYHRDGDKLLVTHYCAQGVQPRMKLASCDNGVLKFDFVDSTNLKSRDEGHMDSLKITVKDDTLTENWSYFKDGKTTGHTEFTLKRKAA